MISNKNKSGKANAPLDLFIFFFLCVLLFISIAQLSVVIIGDQFNEQFFLNICWTISVVVLIVVSQLKANKTITRIKNEVQSTLTTTASSYIRQGDDAELMDVK